MHAATVTAAFPRSDLSPGPSRPLLPAAAMAMAATASVVVLSMTSMAVAAALVMRVVAMVVVVTVVVVVVVVARAREPRLLSTMASTAEASDQGGGDPAGSGGGMIFSIAPECSAASSVWR